MIDQRIRRNPIAANCTGSLKEAAEAMAEKLQLEDVLAILELGEKHGSANLKDFWMWKEFQKEIFSVVDEHTIDHVNCPACEARRPRRPRRPFLVS
jgi:hypothetical protein